MFTPLDWLVLVIYLLLSAGLGLYMGRGNHTLRDYLFGGGTMPWVAVGISLVATSVSATTFLGNPAEVYANDMSFILFNVGAIASVVIVGTWFLPRLLGAGVQSAYELLEVRFNRSVRLMASLFYSMHLLLRTGILLYAPSIVLSNMLEIPISIAIIISAATAILYTWFGGIKAVIWTDVLQFCVLLGGGLLALLVVIGEVGSPVELFNLARDAGKTRWLHWDFSPSNSRGILTAGLIYMVIEVAIRGCDQQFVQRYLSCKSIKDANRSNLLSALLGGFVGLVFYAVGAALFVFYRVLGASQLPPDTPVDKVFPWFILYDLPPGITGLMVAAIYAAAMSSLDSAITALSNTTLVDFMGDKGEDEQKSVKKARLLVVFWGLLGTGAAILAAQVEGSLLYRAVFFTGLFTGPLLGLFLLAFLRPHTNPTVVMVSAFAGMLSLIPFNKVPLFPSYQPLVIFSSLWNPLISLTTTLVFAMLLNSVIPRRQINTVA